MGEIVQGVNAPRIPGAIVRRMHNSIEDRIPKLHIWIAHVNFSPQYVRTIWELPLTHPVEEVEVFLYTPIAVGAQFARRTNRPPVGADLFVGEAVNIRLPFADELHRAGKQLFKVV